MSTKLTVTLILVFIFYAEASKASNYNRGRCRFSDNVVYENGVAHPATAEQQRQIDEWSAEMDQWGIDFNNYMNDYMDNLFRGQHDNVEAKAPQAPTPPCVCSPQYC